jgi:hypothetical protein
MSTSGMVRNSFKAGVEAEERGEGGERRVSWKCCSRVDISRTICMTCLSMCQSRPGFLYARKLFLTTPAILSCLNLTCTGRHRLPHLMIHHLIQVCTLLNITASPRGWESASSYPLQSKVAHRWKTDNVQPVLSLST